MSEATLIRRFLSTLEPVATLPWFSQELYEEMSALGVPLGFGGYFLSRAAPLGPVPADVAVALFYNWNPAMIRRDLKWVASPEDVRAAYLRGALRAYERVLGDDARGDGVVEAADLLREAADACPIEGRPIYAAYASQPWPEEPVLRMLHAATMLREFRGDTHNAILVSHGIEPTDALVLNAAWIEADATKYLASREWTPEDAQPAIARLQRRAFLDAAGTITEGGLKFREMIEHDTDRRCAAPVVALGQDRAERALTLIEPLSKRILEARAVPSLVGRVAGRSRP